MRQSVSVWNPWILLPAGVIVAATGLIIYAQTARRQKRFTSETEAEVLSVTRSSHHANGVTRHVYTPKVAYTVDGNRYEVMGQGAGQSDYYTQGARIPVHYRPDKPEKCLTLPFADSKRGANITMLIGAGIALLGVTSMFVGR